MHAVAVVPRPESVQGCPELAAGDGEPGGPSRSAPVLGQSDLRLVVTAAGEEPRRQRVRVPHVAGRLLVPAPRVRGEVGQQPKDRLSVLGVGAEPLWRTNRLGSVGYQAVPPRMDLVAEQS